MYLGVDGGGTKTAFVILDKHGNLRAKHEEKTAYYLEVGIDSMSQTLKNGIFSVLQKASVTTSNIDYCFIGLPSYGEDIDYTKTVDQFPAHFFSTKKYQCGNDMICGWAAALGCKDGINIIAGTGSIAYGENHQYRARCGGWGELFSDEGSAYWVARSGLEAFTQMSDGRLKKGPLYQLIKDSLALKDDLDICELVLNQWRGARSKIASVAVIVHEAALLGDVTSISIFEKAANELALIIEATATKLEFEPTDEIPVSYSGGIFNTKDLILEPLSNNLKASPLNYRLIAPMYQPVVGAALYAAKIDGHHFTNEQLEHLRFSET